MKRLALILFLLLSLTGCSLAPDEYLYVAPHVDIITQSSTSAAATVENYLSLKNAILSMVRSGQTEGVIRASSYDGEVEEDLAEAAVTRSSVDAEFGIRGGCRAKIHAGPGMVKVQGQADKEVKFVYDLDLFMPGQVQINLSAGALQTLHAQAYPLFRGAITDTLHDALKPVE